MKIIQEIVTICGWMWWGCTASMEEPVYTNYRIFRKCKLSPECILKVSYAGYGEIMVSLTDRYLTRIELEKMIGCDIIHESYLLDVDGYFFVFDTEDKKNWFILNYL